MHRWIVIWNKRIDRLDKGIKIEEEKEKEIELDLKIHIYIYILDR